MAYDVAIVGAGVAGLTAAIYARRRELKTVVISIDVGGQTNLAGYIENYPGFDSIKGAELVKNFYQKAISLGAEFVFDEVKEIKKQKDVFRLKLSKSRIEARTVILAIGKKPRKLGVKGEQEFLGKGVSTCSICDGPLYKGKVVAVVGGGNSAIDSALYLTEIVKKVYLIHRRNTFVADETSVNKLKSKENVEFLLNAVVKEIKGDKVVKAIVVEQENKQKEIAVDGVFVEIGFEASTDWLKGLIELDEKGQIIINNLCQTSVPGIFAAGDCTNMPFKQVVISAGQGAIAALSAYQYLTKGKGILVDWK
jgi:thioredoxin reductase (NADPH)